MENTITLVSGALSRSWPNVSGSVKVGHSESCATMAARALLLTCFSSFIRVTIQPARSGLPDDRGA
jgi:hypothetical protein